MKQATYRQDAANRIALPQQTIKRIADAAARSLHDPQVYIFGSYARGDQHHDSDIDVYVLSPDAQNSRHDAVVKLGVGLFGLGIPRDILVNTPEQFEENARVLESVEADVKREGILSYG